MPLSRSSHQRFKYEPLDPSTPSFRLLRIRHATEGPIECILANHTFKARRFPSYRSISYVWGSSEKPQSIFVNDERLYVTQSLFDMLHSLRSTESEAEYFWIDFLCIDQDNLDERNHQVQQMKTIFASARAVIFYLGQPTSDTDLLLGAIRRFDQEMSRRPRSPTEDEKAYNTRVSSMWVEAEASLRDAYPGATQRLQLAVRDILERPWFQRAWIVQEVGNARSGIVRCGKSEVSTSAFASAIENLEMNVDQHCQNIINSMPELLHSARDGTGYTLFELLLRFRDAKATFARDRIYGVLGLSSVGTNTRPLLVDYHRTDVDVIRDTIAHICDCDIDQLTQHPYPTIESFLADLEAVPGKILSMLLFKGDFPAMIRMGERSEIYPYIQTWTTTRVRDPAWVLQQFPRNPRCPGQAVVIKLVRRHQVPDLPHLRSGSPTTFCVHVQMLFPAPSQRSLSEPLSTHARLFRCESGDWATVLGGLGREEEGVFQAIACDLFDPAVDEYNGFDRIKKRWVDVTFLFQQQADPERILSAVLDSVTSYSG